MRRRFPCGRRRSVGLALSREIRSETMRRAMELVFYLLLYQPAYLIPANAAVAHGMIEPADAGSGIKITDRFGHSYLLVEVSEDCYPDWEQAYEKYLGLAAKFTGFPIQDREELLGAMISGVIAQGDWPETEAGDDPPLVRIYDLAEPLGFSPIDISARMHAYRMWMLEFGVAEPPSHEQSWHEYGEDDDASRG